MTRDTTKPALLSVRDLRKHFPVTQGVLGRVAGHVLAVDGVSFDVYEGETLGMVGESGCGKTTIGRCILRLIEPTSGSVSFAGKELTSLDDGAMRAVRRDLQIVFQDPFSSLNPRMRVGDIVGEPLLVHGLATAATVRAEVERLLDRVGMPPAAIDRYPHEFSGGQRQRIGIARALALNPRLIVCDEAVSALDVSIQAQVVNLLIELREQFGISYLFIAHDLSVVKHIAHRIAVMYLGQMVELTTSAELFQQPAHPYTQALLSAIPVADPRIKKERIVLEGDVPSPLNPPSGCRFHPRCPAAVERCSQEEPRTVRVGDGAAHEVKCLHAYDLEGDGRWHLKMAERVADARRARTSSRLARRPASELAAQTASDLDEEDEPFFDVPTAHLRWITGSVLAISAIALVATGHYFSAIIPALVALAAIGRRERLAVALALLTVFALRVSQTGQRKTALAERQLAELRGELQAFAALRGAFPSQLTDLGWRLRGVFPDGTAVDPWGNSWSYRRDGDGFTLRSRGRDGKESADDLSASSSVQSPR